MTTMLKKLLKTKFFPTIFTYRRTWNMLLKIMRLLKSFHISVMRSLNPTHHLFVSQIFSLAKISTTQNNNTRIILLCAKSMKKHMPTIIYPYREEQYSAIFRSSLSQVNMSLFPKTTVQSYTLSSAILAFVPQLKTLSRQ